MPKRKYGTTKYYPRKRSRYPSAAKKYNNHKYNYKFHKSIQPIKSVTNWYPVKNTGNSYMPLVFQTKLIYNLNADVTMGAGNYWKNVYRGNSIYDPDFTGVGTTVLGHAELSAIYGRYRVTGSRITVTYCSKTSAGGGVTLITYPTRTDPSASGITTVTNHPNKAEKSADNDGQPAQVQSYCSTRAMCATSSGDDFGFGTTMGTNPSTVWYWDVMAIGTLNDTGRVRLCIEYFVTLYDLQPTIPS